MINLLSLGAFEVEVMRPKVDLPLKEIHPFMGPFPSGASAITISSAARLGWKCAFVGLTGKDIFGDVVYNRLVADGVNMSGVLRSPKGKTGIAFVSYRSDGSRNYIFYENSESKNINKDQFKFDEWGKVDWLHVNGCSIINSEFWQKTCEFALDKILSNEGKLSFDPNIRVELADLSLSRKICFPYISKSALFMPNEEEITGLFNKDLEGSIKEALSMGSGLVIIKRGANGCLIVSEKESITVEGFNVQCIDPTGAGDTFNAAFMFGYSKGLSLKEVGIFANAAAAISTLKLGPMEGCAKLNEIGKFLKDNGYENLSTKLLGM
jgi:sugar/nucleoside kinase (ribokinase family)